MAAEQFQHYRRVARYPLTHVSPKIGPIYGLNTSIVLRSITIHVCLTFDVQQLRAETMWSHILPKTLTESPLHFRTLSGPRDTHMYLP